MKRKSPVSALPALLVIPDGEDEASFARHNKLIKTELTKRGKGNTLVINELVKQSFAMRRKDITENAMHTNMILDKYPFLKEPNQVLHALFFKCFIPYRNSYSRKWRGYVTVIVHRGNPGDKNGQTKLLLKLTWKRKISLDFVNN